MQLSRRRPPHAAKSSLHKLSSTLALALLFAACKHEEKPEAAAPVAVRTIKVARGNVSRTLEVAGTLEAPPGLDVKLGPLVAGRLSRVLVAEGDAVAQGQLLAQLDQLPLRDSLSQAAAQLAQAKAQEGNARTRLDRSRRAFDAGVAAKQEVDDGQLAVDTATASVRAAEAAVSTAKNQLGRSDLRSPFAGVVAHVFAAAGEPVDAGKPVVEVARTVVLELRAPIASGLAGGVRKGQPAQISVDGSGGAPIEGVVIAVSPVVDAATGAALVRIRVDNPRLELKGGSLARAKIASDEHRGVLLVPRAALLSDPDGKASAAMLVEGGKAKKVVVQLGFQDDQQAEVREGLAEGAEVIVQGAYALPDGTPVKNEPDGKPDADEKKADDKKPAEDEKKPDAKEPAADAGPRLPGPR